MTPAEYSTYQLSELVLKVRDDLNVSLRTDAGEPVWLLEDERSGRFYRVGQREYAFVSQLDGRRTFGAALGRSAAWLNDQALSAEEAAGLARWLVESGLATTPQSTTTIRVLQADERRTRLSWLSRLSNPLSFSIPLGRPDSALRGLNVLCGWLLSGPVLAASLALIGYALLLVAQGWDRFWGTAPSIVAQDNWVWLAISWLMLKLVHETAHGVACRRFGGAVPEAGVSFVLFVPLPYVDVTSAWRCGSRWRRILVSAAGMWAEMVVGAIAAILWQQNEPGIFQQRAQSVAISATLVTLLFNANPLMRFDGYFILTDLCGLPNLAEQGRQAWRSLGRRWCLGLRGELPGRSPARRGAILTYGLAAMLWRVSMCAGLILAADALFLGAGIILAAFAAVVWILTPVARLLWFVARGTPLEQPSRLRFVGAASILAAVVVLGGREIHWRRRVEVPAIVAYHPLSEVRPQVAGFITQLAVSDGQRVERGQELFRLHNAELEAELADLSGQIEQAQVRARQWLQAEDLPQWEAEQQRLQALELRQNLLTSRQAGLVVRATRAGQLLTFGTRSLLGRYVQAGETVLTIGEPADKQVLALIEPADRSEFESQIGQRLQFRVNGRWSSPFEAQLSVVTSRADVTLPHPALGAHADGPLEVRPALAAEEPGRADQYELVEPRLQLQLSLATTDGERLAAGEAGRIELAATGQSLATLASELLADWWNRRQTALIERWYR
jgi:putative peptide zinc metalloprotease protein